METQPIHLVTQCVTVIKDVGFPIFVAVFLLIITRKQMRLLTEAINGLTRAFERANIVINHHLQEKK